MQRKKLKILKNSVKLTWFETGFGWIWLSYRHWRIFKNILRCLDYSENLNGKHFENLFHWRSAPGEILPIFKCLLKISSPTKTDFQWICQLYWIDKYFQFFPWILSKVIKIYFRQLFICHPLWHEIKNF